MKSSQKAKTNRLGFKYYDIILVLFVATLIISNIGSTKIVGIGPLTFDGGTILFPLAYVLGGVMTEVYGYKLARRAIWLGFGALLLMVVTFAIIQILPHADSSTTHEAFSTIVGFVPRIVLGSLTAYLAGQFINAKIISRLKARDGDKHYWIRGFIGNSTAQLVDTIIFSTIAFLGVLSTSDFISLVVTVYFIKVIFEIAALPFASYAVDKLKRAENL